MSCVDDGCLIYPSTDTAPTSRAATPQLDGRGLSIQPQTPPAANISPPPPLPPPPPPSPHPPPPIISTITSPSTIGISRTSRDVSSVPSHATAQETNVISWLGRIASPRPPRLRLMCVCMCEYTDDRWIRCRVARFYRAGNSAFRARTCLSGAGAADGK